MVLQDLKQSNKPAFNFALASFVSLLFAVIGLVLLGQGLKEQKQIIKQVGDLQVVAQNIQNLVTAKSLLHGEAAAFLKLEKLVKDFNQQWLVFKQQHDYSAQKVKAVDVVWQKINASAEVILANKKELFPLSSIVHDLLIKIELMYNMNNGLLSMLLNKHGDQQQLVNAKNLNILLLRMSRTIQDVYDGFESIVMCGFGEDFIAVPLILNELSTNNKDAHIKKNEYIKTRVILKNELVLYKEIEKSSSIFYGKAVISHQVRMAKLTMLEDFGNLNSSLNRLNNHNLNKSLIIFTICAWLLVFACIYGYVRALRTGK